MLFQFRESSYDNNKCTFGWKVTYMKSTVRNAKVKKTPNLPIFKLHLKLYLGIYLVALYCMTLIKLNHSRDIIFCITRSDGSPQFIRV